MINTIEASMLKKMFLGGAYRLEAKKEYINELNVFPVPDGDTGTNMSMTMMAASKDVVALESPTMAELAKTISSGTLRGARGNSGVILSQLFRGFTKEVAKYDTLNTKTIATGFENAVETAYRAVMKPKEGTILTVAKETALKAVEVAKQEEDLEKFGKIVLEHAEYTLSQTPEMLPVLKEAGVVDSGGQGLLEVLKGAFDAMIGKEVDYSVEVVKSTKSAPIMTSEEPVEITFGYCTEFIIMSEKPFTEAMEQELKEYLSSIGDSLVVVSDDEIVKVHVHTDHPGLAFEKGLTYGSLSRMKVDNMREEHEEKLIKDAQKIAKQQEAMVKATELPHKEVGFIAVSIGKGVNDIFKELGVDYIIEGGQTMNPSTEDMLNAIHNVNADNIFILPNNKNIILAAEQAKELVEDKNIIVLPTKTIPQGITAMIGYSPEESVKSNETTMLDSIGLVKTGQITYAVRDTSFDGKEIHVDDIMGISDEGIQAVGSDIEAVVFDLLDTMVEEDTEIICIYYGEDVTEEQATQLTEKLEEKYPDCDIELQYGGQPIYYYVLSVE